MLLPIIVSIIVLCGSVLIGYAPFELFARGRKDRPAAIRKDADPVKHAHMLTAHDVTRIRASQNAPSLTRHYDMLGIPQIGPSAPHRGAHVRLVMIDTGLAAYQFEHDTRYCRHPDLVCRYNQADGCLNVTVRRSRTPDTLIVDHDTRVTVMREDLPCVCFTREDDATALHGTHAYGLITGMSDAETIMIKAFDDAGRSDKKTLIRALEKAVALHPDILLIGLKIEDTVDPATPATRYLESLLKQFPYVVAAAGNDGEKMHTPRISYPARFATHAENIFSIGSYGMRKQDPHASSFSQYEPGIGPDFLMPGEQVFSTAIPRVHNEPLYAFLSGTSTAATLFAGMLSLISGEFKDIFSPAQIRYVLTVSARQLSDAAGKKRSLHGIPDLRTALFMLHVLKKTRPKTARFDRTFNRRAKKLMRILTRTPYDFQNRSAQRFMQDVERYARKLTEDSVVRDDQGSDDRRE